MVKKYFFGFTLIEVMIAVAIVAILVVLVITTFTRQIIKGNDAKRKADLDRIKVAVEEYEKDHNCYPLTISCPADAGLDPYLRNIPCDPITHEAYGYDNESIEDGTTCPRWFRIYAALQNTDDTSIIPKIGPDGAYNYYVYSPNAPYPAPVYDVQYGCKYGACVLLKWDPERPPSGGWECDPNTGDPNCFPGSGGCSNPDNNCDPWSGI